MVNKDDPMNRSLVKIQFKSDGSLQSTEAIKLLNQRCEEIYNVLRKLRRNASAFLDNRDKELIKDFNKNIRSYIRHPDIYEMIFGMYTKRERELKERAKGEGKLDISKVTDKHLIDADVSKREFD